MAVIPEVPSWSGLEPMPPVLPSRVLTRADVPRRADRVKLVLFGSWRHHSGWESAVHVVTLVLVATAASLIGGSTSATGVKLVGLVVALVVLLGTETAVRMRLRFPS
jgi:hypothetical protein